ncbi:hypothetical protein J2X36_000572 [Methylobacterium sp. BE186]|uniref:vanadium-dependent haloperoxidase n=1 Tax=Methylobacterium sp. BE186 TaxID=2817715 RepID=UPI002865A99F|nr:vanadium-dependent haloperoxidase [Methylobacterium sp. BE186]MDR7035836.1 hypothetical protein [Methylobacterium sp. BE186]
MDQVHWTRDSGSFPPPVLQPIIDNVIEWYEEQPHTPPVNSVDPNPHFDNVVLDWNQVALDAIRYYSITDPPEDAGYVSRALAMQSIAMFDTLRAIEDQPGFLVTREAPNGIDADAAVTAAAHRILVELFPRYEKALDRAYEAHLDQIKDGRAEDQGVAFGNRIAEAVIESRSDDGSDPYGYLERVAGDDPGAYRPTPPDFTEAIQPHWGQVRPFVLESGDQFRPPPPPALTSRQYTDDLKEVKAFGDLYSDVRSPAQTLSALWWSNDEDTYTRVGQWSDIADRILDAQDRSPLESAYLLTELNVGLADSIIACWDAKFTYDFWRPVTAIREAGRDGNWATRPDPDWLPLLVTTPDHPEYTSGHSILGSTANQVLTDFFGAIPFTGTTETLPGVYLTFPDFEAAAVDEAASRIYAGVHYRVSTERGLFMGEQVGGVIVDAFNRFEPNSDGHLV